MRTDCTTVVSGLPTTSAEKQVSGERPLAVDSRLGENPQDEERSLRSDRVPCHPAA